MNILKIVIKEIVSYDNFVNGVTYVIGQHRVGAREFYGSVSANALYTYHEYLHKLRSFNAIQINNVDKNYHINSLLKKNLKFKKFLNCSIFFNSTASYSLMKHKDNYNVYLYVLKGKKKVQIQNKKRTLIQKQGIKIQKNFSHKVFNQKNTFALSISYKSLGY
jgi:hypothetical protein